MRVLRSKLMVRSKRDQHDKQQIESETIGKKTMLITPLDLQNEPLEFREEIAPGAIEYQADTRQIGPLPVEGKADLIIEHRGPEEIVEDIRVRASYQGEFEVLCARCVDPVTVPLKGEFDLLFRPENADAEAGERAITEDETEIGYYEKSGLLLEDVVREQVLLSLPGRTLCKPDCKGLCAHCGQNLNTGVCHCADGIERIDPRWRALQGLASSLKQ
jgi:uncharacterized protein